MHMALKDQKRHSLSTWKGLKIGTWKGCYKYYYLRHRKEALIDEILKLEKEAYDEIAIQNHRKQLSHKINSSNFKKKVDYWKNK